MSWRRSINIWCDICDDQLVGDLGYQTVTEARRRIRQNGGTYRDGLDLCGDCRPDPEPTP